MLQLTLQLSSLFDHLLLQLPSLLPSSIQLICQLSTLLCMEGLGFVQLLGSTVLKLTTPTHMEGGAVEVNCDITIL